METHKVTTISKKLRLFRIPAIPLSLTVPIIPALYALFVGLYRAAREIRVDKPDKLEVPLGEAQADAFMLLGIAVYDAILWYFLLFVVTLIFAVIFNWTLRQVGGIPFEVIDDDIKQHT